jgi:hypothetical protein
VIRIRYYSRDGDDPTPRSISENARAVPAEPYRDVDNDCGGITAMDVRPEDVRRLGEFGPGQEVFVEGDDPDHAWERETEEGRRNTRIWWRAVVVGR